MLRKQYKLWSVFLITLLHIFLLVIIFSYKNTDEVPTSEYLDSFGIEIATKEQNFSCDVKWWQKDNTQNNEYYLTVPYFAKDERMKVNFISGSEVFLDGVKLERGMKIPALKEGMHEIVCADRTYNLFVVYGSDIPTVHVKTDSGSMDQIYADKTYKEKGYVTILDKSNVEYKGILDYITIRGNYTSTLVKKPFNIKFIEEADLFGMGASEKWCLLANFLDDTMLKDKVGYDFADKVGFEFSPESVLVDLYINGEYIGNYTLSERIEISKARIDINDLEEWNESLNQGLDVKSLEFGGVRGKESYMELGSSMWVDIPNTPEPSKGAYLIEYELASRYDDEISGFISDYGQPIIVKSPEYASKEQVEYIQNYYQQFENAVLSPDGNNALGKHYSEYIDLESYAKMYVYQEFVKNLDAAGTSLFFYKEEGKKLVAGPVWDVDLGFGYPVERDGVDMADPCTLWVAIGHLSNELADKKSVFSMLCQHSDFRMKASEQWEQQFIPYMNELLEEIRSLYEENEASIILDKFKWNYELPYNDVKKEVNRNIDNLCDFIIQREEFLTDIYLSDSWKYPNDR